MKRSNPWLFSSVVAFRCVGALVALLFINALLPLGTPLPALGLFAVLGVVGASLMARSRLTSLGFCAALAAAASAPSALLWLLNSILSRVGLASLSIEGLSMHFATCGTVAAICGLLNTACGAGRAFIRARGQGAQSEMRCGARAREVQSSKEAPVELCRWSFC